MLSWQLKGRWSVIESTAVPRLVEYALCWSLARWMSEILVIQLLCKVTLLPFIIHPLGFSPWVTWNLISSASSLLPLTLKIFLFQHCSSLAHTVTFQRHSLHLLSGCSGSHLLISEFHPVVHYKLALHTSVSKWVKWKMNTPSNDRVCSSKSA